MDIKVTYNVDDISAQVIDDAMSAIDRRIDTVMEDVLRRFNAASLQLVDELTKALNITDERRRERLQRAVVRSLDKWTKGALK